MHNVKNILFLSLVCSLLVLNKSSAQEYLTQRVDSVLTSLENRPQQEKRQGYQDLCLFILRKADTKAEALLQYAKDKDTSDFARMIFNVTHSKVLSREGDTKGALALKLEGLELAEKLDLEPDVIDFNISIANNYLFQNMPDKAKYYLNVAQSLAEKEGNEEYLTHVYYNRGMLQSMIGNLDKATEYYLTMYETVKDRENTPRKRFVLYILVDYFSQTHHPDQLAKFTEILAQHYEQGNPNLPKGHMPIKDIFNKRLSPESIPLYLQTVRVSDSLNLINSLVLSTIALADTYKEIGQPALGIPYLQQTEKKIDTLGKPAWVLDIYYKLVENYVADGNYQKAYDYKLLESKLRDSVRSERVQSNVAELQVKYDTAKKETEISNQKLELEQKAREKNQILMGLVALGLLLLLTFWFFRKRLKDQRTIALQKATLQKNEISELKQTNKLLALHSMIEGQEAERMRIAADLHDSLGGLLSTVKAHFTTIQNEISQLEQLNITGKTNDLIDEACLEVRRISHNMVPQALNLSGLQGAVEDMEEQLKAQGFEVTLEINELPKVDDTNQVMIYRLIQEIISNIVKHSEAKTILIQILGLGDNIQLIVEDDGKGFNYEEALNQKGMGLKSINSRVEFLNGTINWDSRTNKGTTININIPVI